MSDPADVCVIGAGAGGAVAAWGLVARGARVVLVDAGPRFDPARLATHAPDWELRSSAFLEEASRPVHRTWEAASGERLDPRFGALASHSPTALAGPPPARRRSFFYSRALGVGGSTLHYQGEAHRFPPHAFRMASERGVAVDWPIDYDVLAPFYARVERLLGVAGRADNPFKAPRGPYPYPAHPLSAAGQRIAAGARSLGWSLLENPLAILPAPRGPRAACHYCNGCIRGCMVGAKGSVDVAVVPAALGTGRLALRTRWRATHLETRPDGRVAAVIGRRADGAEERIDARAFVVAGGAIETPRLLLNSESVRAPNGLGNDADQVGRHLMETLFVQLFTALAAPAETFAGVPIEARIWDTNGARPDPPGTGRPEGIVLGYSAGPFEGPAGTALEGAEGFGAAHRDALTRHFGAALVLFGIAEQLPRAANRVVRSEARDAFGAPLARIETRLDESDLRALERTRAHLLALADASGLEAPWGQGTAYDTPLATHVAGTCRMGHDPEHSVVDAHGRVHGIDNLFIADASVLPTEGAGDSPSLTIEALALRTAEHLADRLAGVSASGA